MELLEVILSHFDYSVPEVKVHLLTAPDEYLDSRQTSYFDQMTESFAPLGLDFSYDLDTTHTIHARHLIINGEWDILLDRGLDIWQRFDANDAFSVEAGMPEMRRVKQFEVVYQRLG
jgi:ATP-dependent Lon protease